MYTVEMDLKSKEMLSAVLLWNQSVEWMNYSELELEMFRSRIDLVHERLNLEVSRFVEKDVETVLICLDNAIKHLLRISDEEYLSERIPHCKNRDHCISSLRKAQNHFAALLDHPQ